MIPENLEDAVAYVISLFDEDTIRWIMSDCTERDFVGKTHFSLGMSLRNSWGFWTDSPLKQDLLKRGFTHADDMSGIILTSVYRELNKLEWDIEGEAERNRKHWATFGEEA